MRSFEIFLVSMSDLHYEYKDMNTILQ